MRKVSGQLLWGGMAWQAVQHSDLERGCHRGRWGLAGGDVSLCWAACMGCAAQRAANGLLLRCRLSLAALIRCGCDAFFFPCLLGAIKINTSMRKARAAITYVFWLWGNLITCSLLPNPAPSSSQCSDPSPTPLLNAQLSSPMLAWALACTVAHIWTYMHSSMLCNLNSPLGCMRHDAAYAYTATQRIDCSSFSHSHVVSVQNQLSMSASLHQLGLPRGSHSPMLGSELGGLESTVPPLGVWWSIPLPHF